MPDLQLGFHTTFALKKDDVVKILRVASEASGLTDSLPNLIQRTGLGNKKVGPVKSWAFRCGLLTKTHLSREGLVVIEHDPHLSSLVTSWLMHFHLSFGDRGLQPTPQNPADWGGWTWLVYEFLPRQSKFTLETLIAAAQSAFPTETETALKKNLRYVLRAYTEEQALATCQFLQAIGKDTYMAGEARLPNPYLIGYFLTKLWQRDFGSADCIPATTLLDQPMGLAPVLGISQGHLWEWFERLAAIDVVRQTHENGTRMICWCWCDPCLLLEQAYQHA